MAKCGSCGQEMPVGDLNGFDAFWAAYPLKFGKLDAQKAWKGMNSTDRARVMLDLVEERRYFGVTKDTIPQPPYAATYLRKRRWEDPYPTQTIPDPPKPAQPDGGMARQIWNDVKKVASRAPEWAETEPPYAVKPEFARATFAEILKSLKVKSI